MTGRVMAGVGASYEELLEQTSIPMPQNCALQLLLNLRFLSSVLAMPKEAEVQCVGLVRLAPLCFQHQIPRVELFY